MLITLEGVLPAAEVADCRERLATVPWQDGRHTAGSLARHSKHNQQADAGDPAVQALAAAVQARVESHPSLISAALPRRLLAPRFNRYGVGETYGAHIDSALMRVPGPAGRGGAGPSEGGGSLLRTDLSVTLFLSDPDDYDGGELEIEGGAGLQAVKLGAGDLVLYPASTLHRVAPVTRGVRLAAFFWIESLVRDDAARALLFDLDQSIQALTPRGPPDDPILLRLTGIYHNLLRRWAQP